MKVLRDHRTTFKNTCDYLLLLETLSAASLVKAIAGEPGHTRLYVGWSRESRGVEHGGELAEASVCEQQQQPGGEGLVLPVRPETIIYRAVTVL